MDQQTYLKAPVNVKAEVDKALAYVGKMIFGWINGNATVPIPDPQFDMIRQWIVIAKAPRPAPKVVTVETEDTEKFRECLLKIRKYSTSKAVLDWIDEVLPADVVKTLL